MIVTDESVDTLKVKKLPLYVRWRGRKVPVSKLNRSAYFFSVSEILIEPPDFQEVKERIEEFLKKEEITVLLPTWPMNFVRSSVTLLSLLMEGISLRNVSTDNVVLAHVLKEGANIEEIDKISKRSKTYLLFSDLSFLRKNGLLPEENGITIMTKSANLVKYANGHVSVKTSWGVKRVIAKMMNDIGREKFIVYIYHSGKKRMASTIASAFLKNFRCKVRLGWMNPVVASQFGHGTVSVTIVPEV